MKLIALFSFIIVTIDRIIKILIENFLLFGIRNKVINNFFYLTFCKNEGAAFSIFYGKTIFFIVVAAFAVYFLYKSIKNKQKLKKFDIICYSLLFGGIVGNLIDRLLYGYVIDYLDFELFNYNFAIFNFADICIVLGALILLLKKDNE